MRDVNTEYDLLCNLVLYLRESVPPEQMSSSLEDALVDAEFYIECMDLAYISDAEERETEKQNALFYHRS